MDPEERRLIRGIDSDFFLSWSDANHREFPWRRKDVSAFHVLITEMLLRQTRADQVASIWDHFTSKYRDARSIAAAPEEELFNEIAMLGFGKQRVDALRSASTWLIEHHRGKVPKLKEELLATPHVGLYAAHATLCFAFGEAVPVVDTNILRLFARILGRQVRQPDIRRNPWAWEMSLELLPEATRDARLHNYGLLDFTAQICKPRQPQCEVCPISKACAFGIKRLQGKPAIPPW